MSDSTTIARPYAKAVFELAVAHKNLGEWSTWLNLLSQAVLNSESKTFIENPVSTSEQHAVLLSAVLEKALGNIPELASHFVRILADNNRLAILPEMTAIFEVMRSDFEKTMTVDVLTFSEMDKSQQEKLVDTLSKKLQRQVALDIIVDPSLLGGAVIKAGDMVIDGSVRGKLDKLQAELAE